jgi:hypothetical protein
MGQKKVELFGKKGKSVLSLSSSLEVEEGGIGEVQTTVSQGIDDQKSR